MTQAQFQQYQLLQAQGAARGGATAAKASAIQTKSLLTRPSAVPAGAALAPATVSALQKTQASTPHAKSVHSSPAAGTHKEKRKYESLKYVYSLKFWWIRFFNTYFISKGNIYLSVKRSLKYFVTLHYSVFMFKAI